MGKNIYKIITIIIVVILFSTVALKKEIDKSIEIVNEKITETMNDTSKEEKSKEEVNKKTKYTSWNLGDLYKSNSEWEKSLKRFNRDTKELKNYVGKVTKSSKHLLYALNIKEDLDSKIEKLYAYVSLNKDVNKKSYEFTNMEKKLDEVYKVYSSICSDLELEILKLSDKEFKDITRNSKISSKYKIYLNDIRRNKKHYLKANEEELLNGVSDITTLPKNVYELFVNMDKKSSLNPSQYSIVLESENRETRKKAFESESVLYNDNINMLSGLFIGQVKKNIFYSNARGYKNSREMYLSGDNIDTKVYDELISTVNKNLDTLHKYISLRKKVLNLDKVYSYDMYTPIVNPVDENISYDKAQGIIYSALNH